MKILYTPSHDEVAVKRKMLYLEKWPIEKQLEAYAEAAAGRIEKQNQMMKDFADIRKALPFFKEV